MTGFTCRNVAESAEPGFDTLFRSEGSGVAVNTFAGEGTIGSGVMIGTCEVEFRVAGVFNQAPDCSLELSITETWHPPVEVKMIVNGVPILSRERAAELVVCDSDVYEFGNVKFFVGNWEGA